MSNLNDQTIPLTINILPTNIQSSTEQQISLENQQLLCTPTIQHVNFVNLENSNFQQRSSSVIVNPPNIQEKGNKRKRKEECGKQQQEIQLKIPKINLLKNPNEVLGVNRFISPFSDEAKIPLPHELNELSTHGTTVWKRNERERQRVREVNKGYTKLKNTLPLTENDRRLSKVDTLRLAIAYIHHLENLINEGQGHLNDCQCFNYAMGECSSGENSPSPVN
ncbi:BHLH domain-containing protein [Meloidogyne graminicola]|uniref:BHLH domain-containing protein n=1 Tax=Meloidogyne graminicola TaxID=189291 RepID=A0A8S9ZAX3_9BILA|nr:BHLH domain-containing protein [Meloidogyne graminicola]